MLAVIDAMAREARRAALEAPGQGAAGARSCGRATAVAPSARGCGCARLCAAAASPWLSSIRVVVPTRRAAELPYSSVCRVSPGGRQRNEWLSRCIRKRNRRRRARACHHSRTGGARPQASRARMALSGRAGPTGSAREGWVTPSLQLGGPGMVSDPAAATAPADAISGLRRRPAASGSRDALPASLRDSPFVASSRAGAGTSSTGTLPRAAWAAKDAEPRGRQARGPLATGGPRRQGRNSGTSRSRRSGRQSNATPSRGGTAPPGTDSRQQAGGGPPITASGPEDSTRRTASTAWCRTGPRRRSRSRNWSPWTPGAT